MNVTPKQWDELPRGFTLGLLQGTYFGAVVALGLSLGYLLTGWMRGAILCFAYASIYFAFVYFLGFVAVRSERRLANLNRERRTFPCPLGTCRRCDAIRSEEQEARCINAF